MADGGIIPAIVALLLFVLVTGINAFQAYRHRAWLLWSLILSGLREFPIVSSTPLSPKTPLPTSLNPSNHKQRRLTHPFPSHPVFVPSFALRAAISSTSDDRSDEPIYSIAIVPHALAALLLHVAVFALFQRLVWWTAPSPSALTRRALWFAPTYAFRFMYGALVAVAAAQCVPLAIFVWSGLVGQTVVLAVFLALAARFARLRSLLGSIMIIVREQSSFLTVYLFDSLPLLVCFVLFACLHPGTYMPAEYTRLRIDKDSVMQTKMADARVAELTRDAYLTANSRATTETSSV
ncbi:hypothetical protein MPH_10307 [Macrophomina phaseolina MS6]|uniref:RTA-like protein n=1 Tax=Macrophomina phaseolina (strain MS6) TaxID=1126212 RepID=K2RIB4_MACPH|nr:hypothetical protein MPH_10307 [Macrophomina phaseolina MS6]